MDDEQLPLIDDRDRDRDRDDDDDDINEENKKTISRSYE